MSGSKAFILVLKKKKVCVVCIQWAAWVLDLWGFACVYTHVATMMYQLL